MSTCSADRLVLTTLLALDSTRGDGDRPGELGLDADGEDQLTLVARAAEVAVGQRVALSRVGERLGAGEGLGAGLDDEAGVRGDDGLAG